MRLIVFGSLCTRDRKSLDFRVIYYTQKYTNYTDYLPCSKNEHAI